MRKYLTEMDVKVEVQPYRRCQCSIQDRTISWLLATRSQVIPLYELQKQNAFYGVTQAAKKFVAVRLGAVVSELRDMVVDAWRSSTDATVGYPPVTVRNVGKVAPIEEFKGRD